MAETFEDCSHVTQELNVVKELDLIDRVPDELCHMCHCTGNRDLDHPKEKEMQKSKMVV